MRRSVFAVLHHPQKIHIDTRQLYHLEDDIHINDTQYLLALTVFFFPYSLFEVCISDALSTILLAEEHLPSSLLAMSSCEGFVPPYGYRP